MAALVRFLVAVAVPAAAAFGWSRLVGRPDEAANWAVLAGLVAAALAWTAPGRDLRGLLHALWVGPVLSAAAAAIALLPALDEPRPLGERLLVWGCAYAVVVAIARVARLVVAGRPGA